MAASIGPNFNQVGQQPPVHKKHFGEGLKDAFHHAVDGFKSGAHELGNDITSGARNAWSAKTFGDAGEAGATAGAAVGAKIGHDFRWAGGVGIGVAGLAVGGPIAAGLAGVYGGAKAGEIVGKDIGAAAGRHELKNGGTECDAKADEKAGGIVGGIAGAVVGPFSPIAIGYGAFEAGEKVFEPLTTDLGAGAGLLAGVAAHGAKDVGEFAQKTWTTAGNVANDVADKAKDAAHKTHEKLSEWGHKAFFQAGELAYDAGDWAHDVADRPW